MADKLFLYFPQWQGSGETNELYFGAKVLRSNLAEYSFKDVPVQEQESLAINKGILGYASIIEQLRRVKGTVYDARPDEIFTVGGGCDVEIVPISYINACYDGNLTVVWLDAHGDLNTPESSKSKKFHGMPLRVLLGDGDEETVKFVDKLILPKQILFVGVRDLDRPEKDYIKDNKIKLVGVNEVLANCAFRNVYVHLDLDVINPKEFPSVKCPTPGGLSLDEVKRLLSELRSAQRVVGGSIVELTSKDDNNDTEIAADLFRIMAR